MIINVGDYVRVTKPENTSEGPSWLSEMDQYAGRVFVVERQSGVSYNWVVLRAEGETRAERFNIGGNEIFFDVRWLTVVDLVVRFGCQCTACVTLRSGREQYRVAGAKHHDECNCNECKIAKRPPPQCAVDCYDCKPPCKVLADRERARAEALTKYAAPLAAAAKTSVLRQVREERRDSAIAELPDLPPRHPIYKWTGPIPWAPEDY